MTIYNRICPRCKSLVSHKNKKSWKRAVEKELNCRSCTNIVREYKTPSGEKHPMYGKKHSKETIELIRQNTPVYSGEQNSFFGKHHSKTAKQKMSEAWKDRVVSDETKRKLSDMRRGVPKSPEHKRKLRLARIQFIEQNNGICFPSFNPIACEYFDKLNKDRGWELEHALRGGEYKIDELGYWLDAYDKTRNIAVEYNEPFHYKNGKLRERDIRKATEIKEYLGCKFFHYNETTGILHEV